MANFSTPFHRMILAMAVLFALQATAIASSKLSHQPIVLGSGLENPPRAIIEYDGELIAAGSLTWQSVKRTGGVRVNRLARWTDQRWQPYGDVFDNNIQALIEYRGDLIAAGQFTAVGDTTVNGIARWDGATWQPLGEGFWKDKKMQVLALSIYKDELIAGGWFDTAGGRPAKHIARWDGSQWRPFGKGAGNAVRGMTVYDDELVIVGDFNFIDGTHAHRVASWDGTRWRALGGGLNSHVNTVAVYRGELIAAGMLSCAENKPANRIVRWDGKQWHPMGQGMTGVTEESPVGAVFELAVHNNVLFAGGWFRLNADNDAAYLAMWDGYEWQSAGVDLDHSALAMASYKGRLFVGGHFRYADEQLVNRILALDPPRLPTVVADVRPAPRPDTVLDSKVRFGRRGEVEGAIASDSAVPPDGTSAKVVGEQKQLIDEVDPSEQHVGTKSLLRFRAVPVQPPTPYRRLWLSAINDHGEAVGYAAGDQSRRSISLFWSMDQGIALGRDANWVQSVATAINNDGLVMGWASDKFDSQFAFLWDYADTFVRLPAMSHAIAIDHEDRILGIDTTGVSVVWENDALTRLPVLPDGSSFDAVAINGKGWIVGHSAPGRSPSLAYLYRDGHYTPLVIEDGDDDVQVVAISDTGYMLANLFSRDTDAVRVVVWRVQADTVTISDVIEAPSGRNRIVGFDINDAGEVVGYAGWPRRPILFSNGVVHDLNNFAEPLRTPFAVATGINNKRWITAVGDDDRSAYVLIPISACPTDLTGSGDVGIDDVLSFFHAWGSGLEEASRHVDLDGNGLIDAGDLLELLSAWGACP